MANRINEWRPEEDAKLKELYENNLMPAQIARAIGRTVSAVDSRRRKLGLTREFVMEVAPPPEDLAERIKTMNVSQLAQFYNRATSVIVRWMRELQLTRQVVGVRKKAVPANLAQTAEVMTQAELSRLYNTDPRTIRGWLQEAKVAAVTTQERNAQLTKPDPVKAEPAVEVPRREFNGRTKLIAVEAAQFLRRSHQSVHRADIQMYEHTSQTWGDVHNVAHRGVNQYFVAGKGVMWFDDLIVYAETNGFKIKELI
jgi:hypothetical protein